MDACDRRMILNEARDIVLLIMAGLVMTFTGLGCRDCAFNSKIFWIISSFSSLIWVVLWKGNDYIGSYISRKISWLHYPVKRFFIGMVVTIGFSLLAIYLLSTTYNAIFDINISQNVYFPMIITIIISLFLHGRAFLMNWRKTSVDAEKLQKENIMAKYESLKNQVNPHFLFNSLNALTNLVYEDQDKAVKFIKQLSEVYRYVLDTREKEVVPLEEELRFLRAYLFLQQIRFGNKLVVEIDIQNDSEIRIAPLALQMLLENAIKHNVVSEDDPLLIRVYTNSHYIIVENNIQKKAMLGEPSLGVGLENIRKRYEFLSTTRVEVNEDQSRFQVKLPVLTGAAA
ncbi:histidine kinase [Fulvivirgaceae bacterium PWU4]|uniref:Histidine kinase n=1 Tax=Chryseosolibacter histidini TaxID=2782349 RepID=A0AAP2DGG3_9BACT|nr:histidine kinase [Chryseosolibacter histidini]MBT1695775.1 histidine kinase [Chryseosolibacter histidini]